MAVKPPPRRWDDRYAGDDYVFGTQPNDFLAQAIDKVPTGNALCLADGEGRNGVFLAQQGFSVTSVDASAVGLAKARALADEREVAIRTVVADLFDWDPGEDQWDLIVLIFFHMPEDKRVLVHQRAVAALKPGGMLVLEAYTPKQLEFGTGGPPVVEMLQTLATIQRDFAALELLHASELEREVIEGTGHTGRAAVVQLLAQKPW